MDYDEQMAELQKEYIHEAKDKLDNLEELLSLLRSDKNETTYREFIGVIHSLKGTSGSYDLRFTSMACHSFEEYLRTFHFVDLDDEKIDNCFKFIDMLNAHLNLFEPGTFDTKTEELATLHSIEKELGAEHEVHKILLGSPSKFLTKVYKDALTEFKVDFESMDDINEMIESLSVKKFDTLITPFVLKNYKIHDFIKAVRDLEPPNCYINIILIASDPKIKIELEGSERPNYILFNSPNLSVELHEVFKRILYSTTESTDATEEVKILPHEKIIDKSESLKKILFIDDDPSIHVLAKLSLKKLEGVEILYKENGQDGLVDVQTFNPDLILCDVMMPEMDGKAVINSLQENPQTEHYPLVFLTGLDEEEEIKELMECGASGIIKKPINLKEFPNQVKELWTHL